MFSISKIASFAILALGTLASASAIPAVRETVRDLINIPVNVDPVIAPVTTITVRDGDSLASIFANLNSALGPALSGASSAKDPATVQSSAAKVTSLIQSATTSLSALSGQPQSQVLSNLDGTGVLSTSDVASLVGGVINNVFGTFGPLTTGTDAVSSVDALTPLLGVVGILLTVVLGLVGVSALALVGSLLPLILVLVPTVLDLLLPLVLGLL